jgi:hypothetical protein
MQLNRTRHAAIICSLTAAYRRGHLLKLCGARSDLSLHQSLHGSCRLQRRANRHRAKRQCCHTPGGATNQATFQVTLPALAMLITGSIAGWIFDNVGPRALFQTTTLIAVLAVLWMILFRRTLDIPKNDAWSG